MVLVAGRADTKPADAKPAAKKALPAAPDGVTSIIVSGTLEKQGKYVRYAPAILVKVVEAAVPAAAAVPLPAAANTANPAKPVSAPRAK